MASRNYRRNKFANNQPGEFCRNDKLFCGNVPPKREPTSFRINGKLCYSAGGWFNLTYKNASNRRVSVETPQRKQKFRSEALEGPFAKRPNNFASAESLCKKAIINGPIGVIFKTNSHGYPSIVGGHGAPSEVQVSFENFISRMFDLDIEWVSINRDEATKSHYMDLMTLLYFLAAPARVTGGPQLIRCIDAMGEGADWMRRFVRPNSYGYPFAGAISTHNPRELYFQNDFFETIRSERCVTELETSFQSSLTSEVRDIILPNGPQMRTLRVL